MVFKFFLNFRMKQIHCLVQYLNSRVVWNPDWFRFQTRNWIHCSETVFAQIYPYGFGSIELVLKRLRSVLGAPASRWCWTVHVWLTVDHAIRQLKFLMNESDYGWYSLNTLNLLGWKASSSEYEVPCPNFECIRVRWPKRMSVQSHFNVTVWSSMLWHA